jgi:hypothetical protein
MSQTRSDPPNDDTNVIVNSMRKQRRSMRVPIIAGALGLFGLLGIMALGLGSRREEFYKVGGSGQAPRPGEAANAGGSGALGGTAPVQGSQAEVTVHIKPSGQLWVDGQNHGSAVTHHLKLAVGSHTLTVKRPALTIGQTFNVAADTPLTVTFSKADAKVTGANAP